MSGDDGAELVSAYVLSDFSSSFVAMSCSHSSVPAMSEEEGLQLYLCVSREHLNRIQAINCVTPDLAANTKWRPLIGLRERKDDAIRTLRKEHTRRGDGPNSRPYCLPVYSEGSRVLHEKERGDLAWVQVDASKTVLQRRLRLGCVALQRRPPAPAGTLGCWRLPRISWRSRYLNRRGLTSKHSKARITV